MASAPFPDLFFYMPGSEKKNIEKLIKKDPEERSFVKKFPQGFLYRIILHRARIVFSDDQELSCKR
jgi:hypothetical protein